MVANGSLWLSILTLGCGGDVVPFSVALRQRLDELRGYRRSVRVTWAAERRHREHPAQRTPAGSSGPTDDCGAASRGRRTRLGM